MAVSQLARGASVLSLLAAVAAMADPVAPVATTRPTTRATTTRPAAAAVIIDVRVANFAWAFTYPNGKVSNELHVAAGGTVELRLTSGDVIHSMFIPELRVKPDVVPWRTTSVKVLIPADAAKLSLMCAEFCGDRHASCRANVVVHAPDAFDAWLAEKAKP